MPKWFLVAVVVVLCLATAFAVGAGTYGISKDHTQPVPGKK